MMILLNDGIAEETSEETSEETQMEFDEDRQLALATVSDTRDYDLEDRMEAAMISTVALHKIKWFFNEF